MSRKCDYCGAEFPIFREVHKTKVAGTKYQFCDKDCAREHAGLRIQDANNRRHNEAVAIQQQEREAEQQKKDAEIEKARDFKILQQGIDFADWRADCNSCGETLFYPAASDECDSCGTDRRLELRLYADGFKRVMCCCDVCNTSLTLKGLPCDCGGRASASKIKIKPVNTSSDDNDDFEDGGVIFKSPKDIKPTDIKIDFAQQRAEANAIPPSDKSKWLAFILAVLFGGFGVHRFYAGRKVTGVIWLCSLGLFYCGWAVDCLLILLGKFKDGDGRVLSK